MENDFVERIESIIDEYIDNKCFHGVALVSLKGDIVLEKCHGMADEERKIKHNPNLIYKMGSLSKQYAAVLILQQIEKGCLNYDVTLGDLFDDAPKSFRSITIHQLLSHSSGIPSYNNAQWMSLREYEKPHLREMLRRLCFEQALLAPPGTQFSYSNSGYVLLGLILERLCQLPFEAIVFKNIVKPLGLKSTGHGNGRDDECMPGYLRSGGGFVKAPKVNISSILSAGGIFTTPYELFYWGQSFSGNLLLNDQSLEEMLAVQSKNYGYGWYLSSYNRHETESYYAYHGGFMLGYKSYLGRLYDKDRREIGSLVLVDNHSGTGLLNMTHKVLNVFLDSVHP